MAEVGSAAAVALLKKMAYPRTNRGRIRSLLGSINNLTHKEYAMKKCTVGIDAHKASNVIGLAFEDMKGIGRSEQNSGFDPENPKHED